MRSIRIRQCALFGLSPDGHTAETAAAEPVSAKGGVISQTVDPRNIKLPQAGLLREYDTCEKCKAPPGGTTAGPGFLTVRRASLPRSLGVVALLLRARAQTTNVQPDSGSAAPPCPPCPSRR